MLVGSGEETILEFIKGKVGSCMDRALAGDVLPAADDDVAVVVVQFQEPRPAPGTFGGDQGAPTACKRVEDQITTTRTVADRVRQQDHGFASRVGGQLLK